MVLISCHGRHVAVKMATVTPHLSWKMSFLTHFLPFRTMLNNISIGGREAHDKFRFEISGHVAEFLRPYRKDSCQLGRITSDEDYKFLIKRVRLYLRSLVYILIDYPSISASS